jgi:hypothetical protein
LDRTVFDAGQSTRRLASVSFALAAFFAAGEKARMRGSAGAD